MRIGGPIGGFPKFINEGQSAWDCERDIDCYCSQCKQDVSLFRCNLLMNLEIEFDYHEDYPEWQFCVLVCGVCKVGLISLFDFEYGAG